MIDHWRELLLFDLSALNDQTSRMPESAAVTTSPVDLGVPRIASGSRLLTGAVALIFGLFAIVAYAVRAPTGWTVFASGLMLAGASLLSGGLVGFLFGVPRTLTGDNRPPDVTLDGARVALPAYGANTNLEQISDWLTKILVGIGIAQFGAIRSGAAQLFGALAPSLGGEPHSATFAGALVIYFSVLGFLSGWLLTRLFLAPALSAADRRAQVLLAQADLAEAQGDTAKATELRQQALDLLQRATPGAARYEELRRSVPSGPARTWAMERLVSETRQEATKGKFSRDEVRTLFDKGTDGFRIQALALMQGDVGLADFDVALDVIQYPLSPFEQYHGIVLAQRMLAAGVLQAPQKERLKSVLQTQRNDSRFPPGSDRWRLSQMILDSIEGRSSSPP